MEWVTVAQLWDSMCRVRAVWQAKTDSRSYLSEQIISHVPLGNLQVQQSPVFSIITVHTDTQTHRQTYTDRDKDRDKDIHARVIGLYYQGFELL